MNKMLFIPLVLSGLLALAGSFPGVTAGSNHVGGFDKEAASIKLLMSNPDTERAWVNFLLPGPNNALHFINEAIRLPVSDGDGAVAMKLSGTPDSFPIRAGDNPVGADFRNFLTEKNYILSWAFNQLSTPNYIKYLGAISNIGEVEGGTRVSESGTMLLIGIGLVCMGFLGTKKFNK